MPKVQFYNTPAGKEVVKDFIRQQPANDRLVIGEDLKFVELRHPMGPPLCRHIRGDLWEVRSSLPSKREARLIYFFHSKLQMIIVVHGFIKTTRTTPKGDIETAERRRSEYG